MNGNDQKLLEEAIEQDRRYKEAEAFDEMMREVRNHKLALDDDEGAEDEMETLRKAALNMGQP